MAQNCEFKQTVGYPNVKKTFKLVFLASKQLLWIEEVENGQDDGLQIGESRVLIQLNHFFLKKKY